MPTNIDQSVLQGLFDGFPRSQLTTPVKFWDISEAGQVPTYPTVYVAGNTNLVIDGVERPFNDGAFVFMRDDGKLDAISAKSMASGGVTVDGGGRINPSTTDSYTRRTSGNIATLKYSEEAADGVGRLSLTMPENKGYGFSFRYPAHTADDLLKIAEKEGAIVQVKDAQGKTLEGFFTKGKGGILPENYGGITLGRSLDEGQFVSIARRPDGSASLYPYRNYTAAEIDRFTESGKYGAPGNDLANLRSIDGHPINANNYPGLNVELNGVKAPVSPEIASREGATVTEGVPSGKTPAPTTEGVPPSGKPPVPRTEVTMAAESGSAIRKVARHLGPVALVAAPLYESVSDGYQAYHKNGGGLEVAGGVLAGLGKGTVDTLLPGARDGYSDISGGNRTALDRVLNGASDATWTVWAVGAAASLVEAAGVFTIPAVIPTVAGTAIAGIANLGVNAAKGVLKATALAGKDQDGGYIYEGGKAVIYGIEKLVGAGTADSHADNLLRRSAESMSTTGGKGREHPERGLNPSHAFA